MALTLTVIIMMTVLAQEVKCDAGFRQITWLESESEYRAKVLESATPAAVMFTTDDCWRCVLFEGPFAFIGAARPDNPFYKLSIRRGFFDAIGTWEDFHGFPTLCVYENGQVIHGTTGLDLTCVMEALSSVPCYGGNGDVVPFTPEVCEAITA